MTKGLTIGSEVIARCDFQGTTTEHLSFFKGDILTIVECAVIGKQSSKTNNNNNSSNNDSNNRKGNKDQQSNPAKEATADKLIQPERGALNGNDSSNSANIHLTTGEDEDNDDNEKLSKVPRWYVAEFSDGRRGLVPSTHLQKRTEVKLNSMPWFHGKITRDEAERLLQPPKDGLFLVRESTNFPGDYTLCVCYNNKVEHYRTIFMNNKYTIDEEGFFDSLAQLVDHYREDADGLCTSLKISVPKKSNKNDLKAFEVAGYTIKTEDLTFLEENLGRGETGDVVLARYGQQKVAVKIMKDSEEAIRSFTTEASLMTSLKHKNLVRLIGITTEPNVCLVTEFMEKGSLSEYLRTRGRQKVTLKDQIKFAKDTCAGMAYLESKKVVHRDLAARNVLLSEDNTAKVCDFGLASREKFSDIYMYSGTGCRIPIKWTAPESLRSGEFSPKSDMWSFGILLYEIYSFGRVPYPRISLTDVTKYVEDGNRMAPPEGCPPKIYEIMSRAWSAEPKDRPSFADVLEEIEKLDEETVTAT